MVVFLFRPSPQVPKPLVRSAIMCYDAAAYNVKLQAKQLETGGVDITWIYLLSLFMAVNTILWTISYSEVRSLHSKEEVEENLTLALDVIVKCRERWPGTAAASHLYSKLSKACLRSYDVNEGSHPSSSSLSANSPGSLTDANSPPTSEYSSVTAGSLAQSQKPFHSSPPPQFGYVFDQIPEPISTFGYNSAQQNNHSGFRSNSIFMNPSSAQSDRRFSYFPPDFTQPSISNAWNPNAVGTSEAQFTVPAPMNQPMDEEYFMQPATFSFGEHMFQDAGLSTEMRHGSLSQEQQMELMQTLEKDGLSDINNFMSVSSQQYNPVKLI